MFVFVGFGIVIACVLGGYVAMGGHLEVLMQPFEFVIIGGAALGAFIASNATQTHVLKGTLGSFKILLAGKKYKQQDYLELLSALYSLFKLIKTKGELAIGVNVDSGSLSFSLRQQAGNGQNSGGQPFDPGATNAVFGDATDLPLGDEPLGQVIRDGLLSVRV